MKPVLGDRALVRAACAVAAAGVLSCAAVIPLHHWVAARAEIIPLYSADLVLGTVWPAVGALVAVRQPRNRAAWLLLLTSVIGPYLLLAHYAAADAMIRPLPGAAFGAWVASWGFAVYWLCVPLLPVLFPDGRAPSRRWGLFARAVAAAGGCAALAAMLHPGGTDISPRVVNPLGVEGLAGPLGTVTMAGSYATLFFGTLGGVACLVWRGRRATGVERDQLQWLMLGGLVMGVCLGFAALYSSTAPLPEIAMSAGLFALPASIVVAVLRHRLFDVEALLGRSVVYTLLSGFVLAVYAVAVIWLGRLAMGSSLGYLLVGAAAVTVAAGHGAVQRWVESLLFGHRRDPYAVVSRVGRQVAPAGEPVEALERLVDALRRELEVPYVAFAGPAAEVSSGSPVTDLHTVPCPALGRDLGDLRVGLRHPGERLLPQEREAVAEVAGRAATLAYAAGLVQDVAASRARIVAAREEERRRLRADLHDGLGPVLAGTAHQLDALARRLGRAGHEEWSQQLRGQRDRVKAAVGDLRTVVQGLRPPILDQLGLPGALRELVSGYETPVCSHLVAPECADLPAAVEVAAYRIAAEAVSNGVRHSAAGSLRLLAEISGGRFVLTVEDNGRGLPARPRAGVGLGSMRERAEEVGGRLDLLAVPGGGTRVRAVLPLKE
ncbi:sensor histidine kinase [Actinocorallia libanotica]|uniref:Oxygen sensor histidine kinase NreB n=1 Tax=Actinocorallia libanotica TaxID=46162 RepID=A0ABN1RXX8_9ACTN